MIHWRPSASNPQNKKLFAVQFGITKSPAESALDTCYNSNPAIFTSSFHIFLLQSNVVTPPPSSPWCTKLEKTFFFHTHYSFQLSLSTREQDGILTFKVSKKFCNSKVSEYHAYKILSDPKNRAHWDPLMV